MLLDKLIDWLDTTTHAKPIPTPEERVMALTNGGSSRLPEPWGVPAPVYVRTWWGGGKYRTGGIVWHGEYPATEADIKALRAAVGPHVVIDKDSLVGTKDPQYTTFSRKAR